MSTDPATKVSAYFVPRALVALQAAVQSTGDNHTDTINRAIQLYATAVALAGEGGGTFEADLYCGQLFEITIRPVAGSG